MCRWYISKHWGIFTYLGEFFFNLFLITKTTIISLAFSMTILYYGSIKLCRLGLLRIRRPVLANKRSYLDPVWANSRSILIPITTNYRALLDISSSWKNLLTRCQCQTIVCTEKNLNMYIFFPYIFLENISML